MDIASITDPTELKALGYEQMVIIDTAQQNLRVINERLNQIYAEAEHPVMPTPTPLPD